MHIECGFSVIQPLRHARGRASWDTAAMPDRMTEHSELKSLVIHMCMSGSMRYPFSATDVDF